MSAFINNDKVLSLDWNGAFFILTVRNEISASINYLYSADGRNWTSQTLPPSLTSSNPYLAKSVGDKFLIGGNLVSSGNSALINVMDGTKKNILYTASGQLIYDIEKNLEYRNTITFPKSQLLAFGGVLADTAKIAFSYDQGNTWTSSANSAAVFSSTVNGAVWNGRVWVAAGAGGNTLATSLDGNTWTGRGSYAFSSQANAVQWSDQLQHFVAVGAGGNTMAFSQDGVYWYGSNPGIFSAALDVKWNGRIWVAVGVPLVSRNSIAYSTDGLTWSTPAQGNLFSVQGTEVVWNGSTWLAIGQDASSNNVAMSQDGMNWTMFVDASLSGYPTAIYADKNNTILTTSTQILVSANNILPNNTLYSNTYQASAILNDGTKYLFGGTASGGNAIQQYYGVGTALRNIAFSNFSVVNGLASNNANRGVATIPPLTIACGTGTCSLAYSPDGIQWTAIPNAFFGTAYSAAWNGQVWVAVGDPSGTSGTYWCATSYDGILWTGSDNNLLSISYDIEWNGQVFVAVGIQSGAGAIATSPDGFTWTAVSGISSIFTTSVHSILWTGAVWLAYGSGGNTSAGSSLKNASVWTPTSTPNLAITSGTPISTAGATITESLTTGTAAYAFDGSFNATLTEWTTSITPTYSGTGSYAGATTTTYDTSSTLSGEYLNLALGSPVTLQYYYMVFSLADASAIPASWALLGSSDGTTWALLDQVQFPSASYPTNNWKYPYLAIPCNLSTNSTAYQYYQWVFPTNFGATYISVADIQLFGSLVLSNPVPLKPILLKNTVLHPTQLLHVDGLGVLNIYQMTDLSGNVNRTGYINGANVNNTLFGLGTGLVTGSAFDGNNHIVVANNGSISYLSNTASISTLNFDTSYNGSVIQSNLTTVNTACYNTKFILLGGTGSSPITYNVMNNNPISTWYPTVGTSDIFTTVYGLSSNSRYGPVVCPNTIHLLQNDQLRVVTPKFYNSSINPDTSITFNYRPSN